MLAYVIFHSEPCDSITHKVQGSRNVEIRERVIQISGGRLFQAKGIAHTKSHLELCWSVGGGSQMKSMQLK